MPSHLIQTEDRLLATTPCAWESAMRPIADVRVKEVHDRQFSAEIDLCRLPRTAFLGLKLPGARVVAPEGLGFVSVNIVSAGQIRTDSPERGADWATGTAHVVNHDTHRFDFTTGPGLESLALFFQKPLLKEYARKFHGGDVAGLALPTVPTMLESSAGACFLRYANFVWEELGRGGDFLRSPRATEEIEDSLWALLMSAVQSECGESKQVSSGGYTTYVKPAEEYILGNLDTPLRVADIAAAVGVSVPTLNRAFRKCHGIGPKAFVKQRRLERVRSDLLAAEPQQTSVTAIATKHAFWHLSQFAADYKQAFHETPSDTLRRS